MFNFCTIFVRESSPSAATYMLHLIILWFVLPTRALSRLQFHFVGKFRIIFHVRILNAARQCTCAHSQEMYLKYLLMVISFMLANV